MTELQPLSEFFERTEELMCRDLYEEGFRPPNEGEDYAAWLAAAQHYAINEASGIVDSAASVLEALSALRDDINALALDTPQDQAAALDYVIGGARVLGMRELLHLLTKDGQFNTLFDRQSLIERGQKKLTELNSARSWWHGRAWEMFDTLTASGDTKLESVYATIADNLDKDAVANGRSFKAGFKDPAAAVKKAIQRRRAGQPT